MNYWTTERETLSMIYYHEVSTKIYISCRSLSVAVFGQQTGTRGLIGTLDATSLRIRIPNPPLARRATHGRGLSESTRLRGAN